MAKDFFKPKKEAPLPEKVEASEAPLATPFNTRKHADQLAKKPAADALKAKARALADRYPLNPGGVSSDVESADKPKKEKAEKLDASKNPGGVRNPSN